MSVLRGRAGLAALACAMALVVSVPGSAVPALSLSADVPAAPGVNAQLACAQPGSYLTAIRTGRHNGYDRVVFQFAGQVPVATVERADAIYNDPRGYRIPVAGQAYLRVTFDRASAVCQRPQHRTYPGLAALLPDYPRLLMVSAAGDFAGVLVFGLGLAASGGYRVFTLTSPSRVVIDVSHVALPRFRGIWPVASWRAYWAAQYSWLTGHRPWMSDPAQVVRAWAVSRYGAAPAVRTVNAGTVRFTRPDGTMVTVSGTRPLAVPGPWVITRIVYAAGTAGSAVPRCGPRSLAAGLHGFQAGLSNRGYILTLTNTGRVSCSLDGYPGLGLEDTRHRTLPSRTFRGSTYFDPDQGPHLIVLSPGETVSADLAYAAAAGAMPAAAYLEVTPPGAYQHLTVPIPDAPVFIGGGSLYVTAFAQHTRY